MPLRYIDILFTFTLRVLRSAFCVLRACEVGWRAAQVIENKDKSEKINYVNERKLERSYTVK